VDGFPERGEPGSESGAATSALHGGGSTWVTGSYDPELNLIYWGTGNPAPDWNDDTRPGDNRLHLFRWLRWMRNTGKIKWHFQFTPHDVHDWDATEVPILFDAQVKGQTRKIVSMANRTASSMCSTGRPESFCRPLVHQAELDRRNRCEGRPFARRDADPKTGGTLVYPAIFRRR